MRSKLVTVLLVVAALCVVGLVVQYLSQNPSSAPTLISQEDKEFLERMKAKERGKQELLQHPARFIDTGKWDSYDKGILNTYTRATAVEFENKTDFGVKNIAGKITYLLESGAELATVPFSAEGGLAAHESAKLKVQAGEITGKAQRAKIVVTHVSLQE